MLLVGCSEIQYYYQAVTGHIAILNRKQKIEALIKNPDTAPELIKKLKLIQQVRKYAVEQLHLPQIHGYTEYADIEKSHVSTVVTAAPALRLEPHQWCFLFVGCIGYRGYFDPAAAKAYAAEFEKKGWDVAVRGVRAYSTLKWLNNDFMPDYFKDPVLNTFTKLSDNSIIQTLIHEMTHQVVFVAGDTSFNESFAVFVEQEGFKQYLQMQGKKDADAYERYLLKKKDRARFLQIVETYYKKFESLYRSELSEAKKIKKKQRLFAEMRSDYENHRTDFKVLNYQPWFEQSLNNAHLLGIRRYNNYVSAFAQIFQEQNQSWPSFFEKVEEIAALSQEKRHTHLESYQTSQN
ncbi:MAG: aminopeptidase [SAR324 cluster bacterium]|nr:aminopeptidase [SAR324 cluster bacterium]